MNDDLIARAETALEGVTPGPWEACFSFHGDPMVVGPDSPLAVVATPSTSPEDYGRANCEFIAASRELVPALVARYRDSEAYADEGWTWLDVALDALGAKDVFQIATARAERDALRTRVRELEEALRFYAERVHYGGQPISVEHPSPICLDDFGARARAALREDEG